MICRLYRGHWEEIVAHLATVEDQKFAEAVASKVGAAIENQPDAICVEVEARNEHFRRLAGLIENRLPEQAWTILRDVAAADAIAWWDRVDVVMGVSR